MTQPFFRCGNHQGTGSTCGHPLKDADINISVPTLNMNCIYWSVQVECGPALRMYRTQPVSWRSHRDMLDLWKSNNICDKRTCLMELLIKCSRSCWIHTLNALLQQTQAKKKKKCVSISHVQHWFTFFQLINQFVLDGTGQTRTTIDFPPVNRVLLFRAGRTLSHFCECSNGEPFNCYVSTKWDMGLILQFIWVEINLI